VTSPVAQRPSYRVEALAKGLRILALFSGERSSMRLKEIVELSGIPMPTAFRLVSTLESEGYLERMPDGSVRPGVAVLGLGYAALQGLDLVQAASTAISQLARTTGETVNLGVLVGDQVMFVARVQRPYSLVAANIRVGSMVPAVFSSIGKVLLAALEPSELEKRLTPSSFTGTWGPGAVGSRAALAAQLMRARAEGFVVQHEEAVGGLASIAAPIRELGQGVVAAMNLAVSAAEFTPEKMVEELLGPLLDACADVSARLGAPAV
jgi:IclR family pca regulon transcriptional regulator